MIDSIAFYLFFISLAPLVKNVNIRLFYVLLVLTLSLIDTCYTAFLDHITFPRILGINLDVILYTAKIFPFITFATFVFIITNICLCFFVNAFTKISRKMIPVLFVTLMIFPGTLVAYKDVTKDACKYIADQYRYKNWTLERTAARELGICNYHKLDDIYAHSGKNLVMIYCESFESEFLKNEFTNLMPGVHELVDSGEFKVYSNYNMMQGAHATVNAIYATCTGFPLFSPVDYTQKSRQYSFIDVLRKANYNCRFVCGHPYNFSNFNDLIRNLGFTSDFVNIDDNNKSIWGAHDKERFNAAKKLYQRMNQSNLPFVLTFITADTHFPNGFPDMSMDKYVDQRIPRNSHEYTYACLSYLLHDFVKFVRSQPNAYDTVIVILGDHLLMGSEQITPLTKKLNKYDRRVMLMTNKEIKRIKQDAPIAFYDMPNIILDLLEVDTNSRFGKYVIPEYSEKYINDHKELFRVLANR